MVADGTCHGGKDGSKWHLGLIPSDSGRKTQLNRCSLNRQIKVTIQPILSLLCDEIQTIFCYSPCEVVGDHSSSYGHLLEGKNELSDPDETHNVVPHKVLKRPLHFIFNNICRVVFYWRPCEETQERVCMFLSHIHCHFLEKMKCLHLPYPCIPLYFTNIINMYFSWTAIEHNVSKVALNVTPVSLLAVF